MRGRRPDRFELLGFLPSAGVLLVWAVLMFDAGGFRPTTWLPAGVLLLALLVLAAMASGRVLPQPGVLRRALLALMAFTAWCFLSLLWSDDAGSTWEASDLLLVGLLGAWTLALAPWRPATAMWLMVAFSCAAAIACLAGLLVALGEADLTSRFEDFRFSPPLDYPNTTAAFAFMAAIPALLLAVRPDASIPAKALGQGLATFLAGFALLPQSRGAILGGAATLVVLAIVIPYRWRLLWHGGLLTLALLVVSGPAGDVYRSATRGHPSDALGDATFALGGVTLFCILLGGLLAAAELRFTLHGHQRRMARRVGFALCGLVAAGVLAVAGVKAGAISDTVSAQWRSLSHPGVKFAGTVANGDSGRLSSTDPLERYDYWRVDVHGFLGAPLGGAGAGSFEHHYLIDRRYPKVSRYPHNLAVKVLGETGLVGVLLVAAFVAFVAIGLWRARRLRAPQRAVAAIALAMLAYFIAHGMFDWLEAYPVLVGPALGFPLVALAALEPEHEPDAFQSGVAVWAVAGVAAVLAALSLVSPWLAIRYQERATDAWRTEPVAAQHDLDRAASLNPLSAEPETLRGVIGLSSGDLVSAERGFRAALEREQRWLPHFGLGVVAAARRDRATADREFAEAKRLNPPDELLAQVIKQAGKQRPVQPAQLIHDVLVSPFSSKERLN